MTQGQKPITWREVRLIAINTIISVLVEDEIWRRDNYGDEQLKAVHTEMGKILKKIRKDLKVDELPSHFNLIDLECDGLEQLRDDLKAHEERKAWERKVQRRNHIQSPEMAMEKLKSHPHPTRTININGVLEEVYGITIDQAEVGKRLQWTDDTVAMWLVPVTSGGDGRYTKQLCIAVE